MSTGSRQPTSYLMTSGSTSDAGTHRTGSSVAASDPRGHGIARLVRSSSRLASRRSSSERDPPAHQTAAVRSATIATKRRQARETLPSVSSTQPALKPHVRQPRLAGNNVVAVTMGAQVATTINTPAVISASRII